MQNDLPEEVNKLIGKNSFTDQSPIMIQKGLWQNFCSSIEDGNKIYWDERVAECHTEDLIAHPAMLPSWVHDFEWHPQRKKVQPMELHFHLKNILNLPLGIVTEVDIEYYLPIKDGDAISANQTLLSVSELVKTKLGEGRYWVIEVKYFNQLEILVGKQNIHFLGYKK
tara:strand:+ start:7485 stop:7988 length:504 start_codon:yes stop_codon:yes gene_type:complete